MPSTTSNCLWARRWTPHWLVIYQSMSAWLRKVLYGQEGNLYKLLFTNYYKITVSCQQDHNTGAVHLQSMFMNSGGYTLLCSMIDLEPVPGVPSPVTQWHLSFAPVHHNPQKNEVGMVNGWIERLLLQNHTEENISVAACVQDSSLMLFGFLQQCWGPSWWIWFLIPSSHQNVG